MRRAAIRHGFRIVPGPLTDRLNRSMESAARAAEGLWRRSPAAWTADDAVAKKIANRLGWLDSPALMRQSLDRLRETAAAATRAGYTDVVLLGMGGSSLAPEVLRAIFGERTGYPRLHVLDSTDPAAIHAVRTELSRTLFLVSSKSGTTIEPTSLAAYFRQLLEQAGITAWGDHFIAVTDAGTELAMQARDGHFADTFINPSDIGGRYSALSFFGLVPAALAGQDIAALVDWGTDMLEEAQSPVDDLLSSPAVGLGLLMGAAAQGGRDKLTLVLPSSFGPFGLWVEQLVAESTGKQGLGIVPIAGESLAAPAAYGSDRVFVRIRRADDPTEADRDRLMEALGSWPVATIDLPELAALGGEFVRWEIATAVAGAILGINPFDEPNVQQAKDATNTLLDEVRSKGHLPRPAVGETLEGNVTMTASGAARKALHGRPAEALLGLLAPGDYAAVLAYLGPDPALGDALRRFRMAIRDRSAVATMLGYGPRYLHSTGQLHKGGPNTGVFVLVSAEPADDLAIPGQPFSFGTLELAQALGDFQSLDNAGRRALHVHLPRPDPLLLVGTLDRLAPYAPPRPPAS
jgi:glucose-6-phosphate isomerase